MKYSYNWLKDYIVDKLPEPKKLAELLMGRSFEIDALEKKGQDWVLDIKVLSNRAADCLSHIGIAREIAAITSLKFKAFDPSSSALSSLPKGSGRGLQSSKLEEDTKIKSVDFVRVEVQDKRDCARYTASVVTGVKVGQSPKWLQDRLVACGLQVINNIVDITNYVMLETGQPLHAFDADKIGVKSEFSIFNFQFSNKSKIQKKKIIVRRAKKGEVIKTLDKEKTNVVFDESILVIADEKKPIAIAGIKGGLETGIDKSTKNIVIEAANFDSVLIRHASQKLKIRTDASWRFENGIDLHLIDLAQKRVCYLIREISGGKIAKDLVNVSVVLPKPKQIRLQLDYLNRLLGMVIPKDRAIKILDCLGCRIAKKGADFLLVQIPTARLDLKTPEDLIEEIGRLWGYEKMPKTFPQITLVAPAKNKNFVLENQAKDILVNLGFCEAYNYTFIGEKEKEVFGYGAGELMGLANPMSELNKFLRPFLGLHLLKNAKENLKNFPVVKMFEIGKVFADKKETLQLGLIMAGKKKGSDLFYETKGSIEKLLGELNIGDVSFIGLDQRSRYWQEGRAAEILAGKKVIGAMGEIRVALLETLGIKEKVVMAEIDLQSVFASSSGPKTFQPFSIYPASLRDIALLVPQEIKAIDVLETIKRAGGKLLVEVELFDVYTGPGLPAGRKNLAFHLVYQSNEKTLSAEEVNGVQQKITMATEKAGWEVRR